MIEDTVNDVIRSTNGLQLTKSGTIFWQGIGSLITFLGLTIFVTATRLGQNKEEN